MRLFHSLRETRALRDDSQGNVLIMMAALLIPMLFAVGMGIDYGRAQTQQTRMNAAADAAALAGTNATLMQQSTDTRWRPPARSSFRRSAGCRTSSSTPPPISTSAWSIPARSTAAARSW
jgi:uncharacterized membrane protein